ncbi:MAG: LacI family DNA-binding transcriptional regulator [Actinophytocola sp.]|nr:LacI family DNA-binding transcriptional regulator [Actinophytocola sp.]
MSDVAKQAGVSRALVSLIFRNAPGASEQTRERVFEVAREIGYRPDTAARTLASSRTKTLGVLLTIRNPFHADLVEACYAEADRLGFDIVLSTTVPTRDEERAIDALLGHRCEALILFGPKASAAYLTQLGREYPVVSISRRVPDAPLDVVHTAEAKGVRQAVDYLVGEGHRDIIHIDGGTGPGSAERKRAYRAAMRKHGLADHGRVIPGNHTEDSGVHAAEVLLAEDALPTAVLAANDRCALGLLGALHKAGVKVPQEVSVVGYDDSRVAMLSHIGLTTVHQNADELGRLAVRAAVERTETPAMPGRELVLDPELRVRGTSGPPR